MGNFNNNRLNRGRTSDDRGFRPPQMHTAICSKCGKPCQVPFRPTGNRPIFCSDCFRTEGGSSSTRRLDERNPQTASDRSNRPMYDAICDKCGNRCQIPFQPKPGKQVFCSHCFEQQGKEGRDIQEKPRNNDQFDALNTKLDKILQLLSSQVTVVTAPEKVTTKVIETPESKKIEKKVGKKSPAKKKTASQKKTSAKKA